MCCSPATGSCGAGTVRNRMKTLELLCILYYTLYGGAVVITATNKTVFVLYIGRDVYSLPTDTGVHSWFRSCCWHWGERKGIIVNSCCFRCPHALHEFPRNYFTVWLSPYCFPRAFEVISNEMFPASSGRSTDELPFARPAALFRCSAAAAVVVVNQSTRNINK